MDECKRCGGRTVKNGSVHGLGKRQCKECGFQSVGRDSRGKSQEVRDFGVWLYCHGLSMSAVGKALGVSATAVMKWIQKAARTHGAKPDPGRAVIVELDEMWHFLGSKKTNAGYGKHMIVMRTGLLTGNVGIVMLPLSENCSNG